MDKRPTFPKARTLSVPRDMCVFTVDVEDWFHIMDLPSAPRMEEWQALPSHIEKNFLTLLDILDAHGTKATCFFLGWIADRYPGLVRQAAGRGHEIASHGYAHGLVYQMSPEEFLEDICRAKDLLENLTGRPVPGYRAPGFSVTAQTPWFFEKLAQAGYQYSSSIFPSGRLHGGYPGFRAEPCIVETLNGLVCEVPIPLASLFSRRMCFFGGGYLRLFPYALIKHMARQVLAEARPVVYYIHPREIDPQHPRLPMPFGRRIKSYIGLRSTEAKLKHLLGDFNFVPFAKLLHTSLGASQ